MRKHLFLVCLTGADDSGERKYGLTKCE